MLEDKLFVLPEDIVSQLRLLAQRCAFASGPAGSSGGIASAQDSILRENLLQLLWRYPKSERLLRGASTSMEAFTYMERLYASLPSDQRSSDAKPLQRLQAAEDSLHDDQVDAEIALTTDLNKRVSGMEKFARDVREAKGKDGDSSGGGSAADYLSASIGGRARIQKAALFGGARSGLSAAAHERHLLSGPPRSHGTGSCSPPLPLVTAGC